MSKTLLLLLKKSSMAMRDVEEDEHAFCILTINSHKFGMSKKLPMRSSECTFDWVSVGGIPYRYLHVRWAADKRMSGDLFAQSIFIFVNDGPG